MTYTIVVDGVPVGSFQSQWDALKGIVTLGKGTIEER